MKIAALYYPKPPLDFFEASVRAVSSVSNQIFIIHNHAEKLQINLQEMIQGVANGLRCTVWGGEWESEVESANSLLLHLQSCQFTHLLHLQPFDIFSRDHLRNLVRFMDLHPEAAQYTVHCRNYWKSPHFLIDPSDLETPAVASRLSLSIRFIKPGMTNCQPIRLVPEGETVCHRFLFACSESGIFSWLTQMQIPEGQQRQWKNKVWNFWDSHCELRDLHPTQPERFKRAIRIHPLQLPEALTGHSTLKSEIREKRTKKKPHFSLLISSNCFSKEIRTPISLNPPHPDFMDSLGSPLSGLSPRLDKVYLFQNLAATVPPDTEIILAVPKSDPDYALFVSQIPAAKFVSVDQNESILEIWQKCLEYAEGNWIVFMNDIFQFEGDWLEGFWDAFEKNQESAICFPRIINLGLVEQTPILEFEKCRSQNSGTTVQITDRENVFDLPLWACDFSSWPLLMQSKGQIPTAFRVLRLDDTVVFQKEADHSPAPQEALFDVSPNSDTFSPLKFHSELEKRFVPDASLQVSIVIPVYNNLHFTRACLDLIFACTPAHLFELIVVDNGSSDGTREYLESLGTRIRYIRNLKNLFFAKGCNRGAWAARGRNILLLNNDVVVRPGWLEPMLEVLDQDPRIAIVGNKQLFPLDHPIYPDKVWHAGVILTPDHAPMQIYYGFDKEHPLVNQQRDYPGVIGSCFLIRREIFEELDGLDTRFINGHEETDLCLRAGEKGYRIVYTPRSEIVHYASSTEGRFDRELSNLMKFQAKWSGKLHSSEPECYRKDGLIPAPSMRPHLRIGVVAPFRQHHRLAHFVESLLDGFPSNSFTVLADSAIKDRLQSPDPAFVLRAWNSLSNWHYPMGRLACSLDFDIIHLHWDSGLCCQGFDHWIRQLKQSGKKIIASIDEIGGGDSGWRAVVENSDALLAPSLDLFRELTSMGFTGSKIFLSNPGIPSLPRIPLQAAREKLGISQQSKIILTFGYLSERKGIEELIEAFRALKKDKSLQLWILGMPDPNIPTSGSYLDRCREKVIQAKLQERIHFVSQYLAEPDLQQYLAAADVIVLPYVLDRHRWSFAAAYALALGCAVITSPAKAFLPFGDAVYMLPSGTSLIQAINEVIRDENFSNQLRQKAFAYAKAHSISKASQDIWDFYSRMTSLNNISRLNENKFLENNLHPTDNDIPRVCWEGSQFINHSLAHVNRELELALLESGSIELRILPVGHDSFFPQLDLRHRKLTEYYGQSADFNPEILVRHQWPPNWEPPLFGRWVVIQPWEYGALPSEWVSKINQSVDEVWAPSNFVRQLYIDSGVDPSRVHVVPNGVNSDFYRPGLPHFPLPTNKNFIFLFVGGTIPRKGADILLRAYQTAFDAKDDVLLVIKDMGTQTAYKGQGIGQRIQEAARNPESPAILYLDQDLSDKAMAELYNTCDCLVHSYRGEGFALPVLEAMSCGLPVIVTAGGATDDFVDDETGIRVPSQKVVFGNREINGMKTVGDLWMLEPDIDELVQKMRWVFENRESARAIGAKARKKVLQGWTWKHAAAKALQPIEALRAKPIYRLQEKVDTTILIFFEQPFTCNAEYHLKTIDSLLRNSYAKIKIFVALSTENRFLKSSLNQAEDLVIFESANFAEAISQIYAGFRAEYLTIITRPTLFSRQWYGQISEVGKKMHGELIILAPVAAESELAHLDSFKRAEDELAFQKYARQQWRNHRGQFRQISDNPTSISCLNWKYLESLNRKISSPLSWYKSLKGKSVKTIQVLDTLVLHPGVHPHFLNG